MNGDPTKKIEAEIKDFKENHTDATVAFTISCTKDTIDRFEKDPKGYSRKIQIEWFSLHIQHASLQRRGSHLQVQQSRGNAARDFQHSPSLTRNVRRSSSRNWAANKRFSDKAGFIEEVCAGDLVVSNRKRADRFFPICRSGDMI
jgi:hypothetical protein